MGKRGRPSEQLKRETTRGRVWSIIQKLREKGDFSKTIRQIADLSGVSVGAVAKTAVWKGYLREKRRNSSIQIASGVAKGGIRRRRRADSVEGRVFQIVEKASNNNDFTLSLRRIASTIGCSPSAVRKTDAYQCYLRARENEKELAKERLRARGIM